MWTHQTSTDGHGAGLETWSPSTAQHEVVFTDSENPIIGKEKMNPD